MKITTEWIKSEGACSDGAAWGMSVVGKGMELSTLIKKMDRADWLMWLLWRSKSVNIRQLVKLACVTGRFSLRHVPEGEDRPRLAFEAAEAWVAADTAAAWDAGAAGDAAWEPCVRGASYDHLIEPARKLVDALSALKAREAKS